MNLAAMPLPPARRIRVSVAIASLRRGALTATAFVLLALSWSPLLPGLLGLPFSVAMVVTFVPLAGLTALEYGVSLHVTRVCLVLLSACLLMLLLSQSTLLLLRIAPLPLPLLIFVACQTRALPGQPQRLCSLMTGFLLLGVAGALLGMLYAWGGGEPVLSIVNVDGRENGLYLTTISNYNFLGVIRPGFVYDEPGAFSAMLCSIVALREALGRSGPASYLLMVRGLVTRNLTHFLILLIYLLYRIGPLKTIALVAALLVSLAPLAAQSDALEFLVSHFSIEDGQSAGDNRSNQVGNFLAVMPPAMVMFGDVECHTRTERVCNEHGDISSSPVTPIYKGGIVALLVQIGVHAGLIIAFFRHPRLRFSALALTLLLLQRPYFEISSYGFITFLLLFMMLRRPTPHGRVSTHSSRVGP